VYESLCCTHWSLYHNFFAQRERIEGNLLPFHKNCTIGCTGSALVRLTLPRKTTSFSRIFCGEGQPLLRKSRTVVWNRSGSSIIAKSPEVSNHAILMCGRLSLSTLFWLG